MRSGAGRFLGRSAKKFRRQPRYRVLCRFANVLPLPFSIGASLPASSCPTRGYGPEERYAIVVVDTRIVNGDRYACPMTWWRSSTRRPTVDWVVCIWRA